jgi:Arc/MetJ-type ribon-helix-helix transcriptional regulator
MTRKVKISVTLPEDLLAWMDGLVRERIFDDRSHGLERAVLCLKCKMEKEGQAPRE